MVQAASQLVSGYLCGGGRCWGQPAQLIDVRDNVAVSCFSERLLAASGGGDEKACAPLG